ncbi:MAG: PIN domain-containing protein [Blastocatellia bacterium]
MADTLYFLDTNILVHLVRENQIGQYIKDQYAVLTAEPRPVISGVTEGELRSLALQWRWGARKQDQMNFLLSYFWRLPIEKPEVYAAYATIDNYSESVGRPMGKNDLWIAASAYAMKACLLTTDKDFDHIHNIFITRDWINPERGKQSQSET